MARGSSNAVKVSLGAATIHPDRHGLDRWESAGTANPVGNPLGQKSHHLSMPHGVKKETHLVANITLQRVQL
jgi:hypothetical protein